MTNQIKASQQSVEDGNICHQNTSSLHIFSPMT